MRKLRLEQTLGVFSVSKNEEPAFRHITRSMKNSIYLIIAVAIGFLMARFFSCGGTKAPTKTETVTKIETVTKWKTDTITIEKWRIVSHVDSFFIEVDNVDELAGVVGHIKKAMKAENEYWMNLALSRQSCIDSLMNLGGGATCALPVNNVQGDTVLFDGQDSVGLAYSFDILGFPYTGRRPGFILKRQQTETFTTTTVTKSQLPSKRTGIKAGVFSIFPEDLNGWELGLIRTGGFGRRGRLEYVIGASSIADFKEPIKPIGVKLDAGILFGK